MEELKLIEDDPWLVSYRRDILRRYQKAVTKRQELAGYGKPLYKSVNSHLYYGVHRSGKSWFFREWAPGATAIYLIGTFNNWKIDTRYALHSKGNGDWELELPADSVRHGDLFKWYVYWNGGEGERMPAYATRCVQDENSKIFSGQIWNAGDYKWKNPRILSKQPPLIYEAHVGMSSENPEVANFDYFREKVLPRIADLGYNTLQIMAIQEHPYYGSFGYQVSAFFAVSSRFGTPEDFKRLVDAAHGYGIAVIIDLIHSHAVSNTLEGLAQIDGNPALYFHEGTRGDHPAWGSKCFNYGKDEVLHFLLSNCKFWLEEYYLDGFRFDGITSMIYLDHGLGRDFTDYSCYFDGNQDEDAMVYLTLANMLIKEINPNAITIAEEMSGMPGLASPFADGGNGFDFRMSMGVPDHWIKWIKELRDEEWNMSNIFHELTRKRSDERTVSYSECHDQALVGDKTIIFRLIDKDMYQYMSRKSPNINVDRGIALHKMIRLLTLTTAGDGYLNFMGNEFGHPEWIDFPREGNGWSYNYARRQWSLADDKKLKYGFLLTFDKAMIELAKETSLFDKPPVSIFEDNERQILIFSRSGLIMAFNFSPYLSYPDYRFNSPVGEYEILLNSDAPEFGGFNRIDQEMKYVTSCENGRNTLSLYLPSRSAVVLREICYL
ncbi:MAG: alpha amylase C-terminal domain-containing protein [Rikenellaceae bacterium]|nr:alpha amylase C-terminal domain-containing protein [Rikenellaceae bacterium]